MSLERALIYRPRRLRQSEAMRRLIRETHLSSDQLVMPLFVRSGKQGIQQGRMEGESRLLAKQLERRFGPLPQAVTDRLAAATEAQVWEILKRAGVSVAAVRVTEGSMCRFSVIAAIRKRGG